MSARPSSRLVHDPAFRRLWIAGLANFLVRWLEVLVFGVFAYQASGSAFVVASLTMLRLLPLALFGLPFGAMATRIDRRLGLIVLLGTMVTTSTVMLLLAALGLLEIWHLAVASFINGMSWAADNPLRRGLIGDLAGPIRMGQAMAFDVGASNASRLAGPGLGGLLLVHGGMPVVFAFTVALYVLAVVAVVGVPPQPAAVRKSSASLRATLGAGFGAMQDSPLLAGTLWVTLIYNLFGWPVLSLVPVIGQDRLGLAPDGVGLLVSLEGIGTLLGAFALASITRPAIYGRIYVIGAFLFLGMLPLVGLSTQVGLSAAGMLMLGVGQSAFSVMQSTLVFVAAPADRRLPAMGLLTVVIGMGPLGFLALGWLAERTGAPVAAAASALAGLVVLAISWPWWRACWQPNPD